MEPHENDGGTGDYEYDLAHDDMPEPEPVPDRPAAAQPPKMPEDEGYGDYSYDLAHDIPPARPRDA